MTPEMLPMFPLQTVLFPGMVLPMHIFERRYRELFAARVARDPIFGVVLTRSGREVGDQPEIHAVGTAATMLRAIRYDDGRVDLAVRGNRRFRVIDGHWDAGYLVSAVEWLPASDDAGTADVGALANQVQSAFATYLQALGSTTGQRLEAPKFSGSPTEIAYAVCALMPFGTAARQRLLETEPPGSLLRELLASLRHELKLLQGTGAGGSITSHPGRGFSMN